MATQDNRIVIRAATQHDEVDLQRLAVLDGDAAAPAGRVFVAEAGGRLRAAYSIADGSYVADPFWHSAELVELLRVHAAALGAPAPGRVRRFSRRHGLRTPAVAELH